MTDTETTAPKIQSEDTTVEKLRQCVEVMQPLETDQKRRVADYLYAWSREPDRSKPIGD